MKNFASESQILAADEARYQALYRQDLEALERMLADDYVHTHANGKIDDKAAFLASIEAARYRFVDARRSEQCVRISGPVVLLSGKTRTTLDVGGQTKVMDNAFVTVWTQAEDGLRLLHWQATKLLEA
ncbi:ketosteroid isomerase-like protein [Variovorax boronicumulans]|uniref:nuclear transport factor 2 family protein n=1 Tax=Variovorax boronicumulans TaxID=436515 RepID=UPI002780D46F|nr:nuclear transport factor 2 family protein [Variovorax boronicumulans]MDP9995720.1 ketosteroid isomerase-like protein [Variovorax boronicumulans]MDQ0006815.1 ketosteroid isomerase-like protein [Variovorax boronicumulans]